MAALSLTSRAQLYKEIEQAWRDSVRQATMSVIRDSIILQDDLRMPLFWTTYGVEPSGGHSLWISLHGGGGTTSEINDSQWRNQMYLYKPREGIYVCPHAPWDAWDMWFQEPIDSMFRTLIRTMVAHYNVNPDRVYILGYSAGGDGLWRLSPRLADHWAAASMMAGHPGDVSLVNLRNTPFMIWAGALDDMYNRNKLAVERAAQMDSLQAADPEGYIHENHIMEGKGHWMDREDRAALPWMAQFRRNAWPRRVVFAQEEVMKPYLYWVGVPRDEMRRGARVDVEVVGNEVRILRSDYSSLTLYLSRRLLRLDKKIKVTYNGKTILRRKVRPSADTYRQTLHQRQDPSFAAEAILHVKLK